MVHVEYTLPHTQHLTKLIEITRHLTETLEPDEVLFRIADGVVNVLDAFGSAIYLLEPDGVTLTPVAVVDPEFYDEIMDTPLHIDDSFTGQAIKTRKCLIFNEMFDGDGGTQIPGTPNLEQECVLTAPLIVDARVLGGMAVSKLDGPFTEQDAQLAELFAGFAAIALKNAQAAEELRRSESRFRMVSELTSDYSFEYRVNPDYSLENVWVTWAMERITGYSREELQAKGGWGSIIHPDDLPIPTRQFHNLLKNKAGVAEYRIITKYGETRWMRDYARPEWDETEQRVVRIFGAVQDITDQKNTELALLESEMRLQQAQKMESIGTLAGGVAHDFNNLLTAINGQAELGLMKLRGEHPAKRNLQGILDAGNRAAKLTGQLLAFSRKQIYRPKLLDVNQHVRDLQSMLRSLIQEDIVLEFVLGSQLPHIKADPNQLEQILVNLVVNARDAVLARERDEYPRKIVVRTVKQFVDEAFVHTHPGSTTGEFVCLCVEDNGIGMDAATQERIFEPFFTTKPKGRGTGLGLSMVYGIVKQNNGNIYADSEPEKGTTMRILWPPHLSENAEEQSDATLVTTLTGTESILLVEDDTAVRSLAADALRAYGYKLTVAENGRRALNILDKNPVSFDMLLTDVIMPEMDGPQLATILLEQNPELPVLFMSGYTRDLIGKNGFSHGKSCFLQKPFTPAKLGEVVRKVLDGKFEPL